MVIGAVVTFFILFCSETFFKLCLNVVLQNHQNFTTIFHQNENLVKSEQEFLVDLIPGTYIYQSSQNFDAYLKALGVSYFLRQLALLATPIVTISNEKPESCEISNLQEEQNKVRESNNCMIE